MNLPLQRLLTVSLLAAATAAVSTNASAAGRLGHQWAEVRLDHIEYESAAFESGSGFSLAYNRPVLTKTDLGLHFSTHDRDGARADVPDASTDQILVTGTFLGPTVETTPYLRLGLGWARAKAGDVNNDSIVHSVGIGCEFPVFGTVMFTGYVDWLDGFDSDYDGTLTYGGIASVAINEEFDVVGRVQGDDHLNVSIALGVLYRF